MRYGVVRLLQWLCSRSWTMVPGWGVVRCVCGHYQHQEAINKTVREAAKINVFNTAWDRKKRGNSTWCGKMKELQTYQHQHQHRHQHRHRHWHQHQHQHRHQHQHQHRAPSPRAVLIKHGTEIKGKEKKKNWPVYPVRVFEMGCS